jgi:ribonuclease T1
MKATSWKQVILYLVIIAALYFFYTVAENSGSSLNCTSPALDQSTTAPSAASETAAGTGSGTIAIADLPQEGKTTLNLIKSGGPFPFTKDGTVFNNYEGLLPKKSSGYYREYTVITPGSKDRGARRIVAGANGEYYYTDDHYKSFKLIRE